MGLKVTENTRREGGSSSRGTSGRKAKRTFIVRYDATTPPASVAAAETADDGTTAIPAVGDGLPGDTTRTVTNVSAKPRDDTGLLFDVEVEYETPELGTFEEDPLTVPVDYDWDFGVGQKTYFKDETTPDPKYVTNSFGDPFDKLLQRDVGEIQVTITDNIDASAWDPVLAAEYLSPATATNAAPMTIDGISISAGQARITGITCSGIKTSNGVS